VAVHAHTILGTATHRESCLRVAYLAKPTNCWASR